MDLNNIPEDIYDWMSLYDFNQLSARKQEQVKITIGESLYREHRAVVRAFQLKETKSMVDDANSKPIWAQIFYHKMPMYQVAALVLLYMAFSSLIQTSLSDSADGPLAVEKNGTPLSQDQYPDKLVFNL